MPDTNKNNRLITLKTFYKSSPWISRLMLVSLILLLVLTLVRAALPQTIIYTATSWLKQQNIDASIENISIGLFDGTITLTNAKGMQDDKLLFKIELIDIHWRWAPLSDKTFNVTNIIIDQFKIDIARYKDNIVIGGVTIPLAKTTDKIKNSQPNNTTINKQATPWSATLNTITFTNLDLCYLQHTTSLAKSNATTKAIDYCITLDELSWNGSINYATNKKLLEAGGIPLSSSGNFNLKGLRITDNKLNKTLLLSASNSLSGITVSGINNINIDQLKIDNLSALQREDKKYKETVRFTQLTIQGIHLTNLDTLSLKTISIDKPNMYIVKKTHTDWEYQQWLPTGINEKAKKIEPDKNQANGLTLTIDNINVSNADFCYLDKTVSLYYCYTASRTSWKGEIRYKSSPSEQDNALRVDGDLNLQSQNIKNLSTNRTLLNVQSLTLNQLKLSNSKLLDIDHLSIDHLSALQRSDKTDDNTLAFDRFLADNVHYSPRHIKVNTLTLHGLSNHVSKNKDGTWEFDKWLTKPPLHKRTNTVEDTKLKDTETALIISVNKINIDTDKNILFTDNSTDPAMTIGLQKLSLNINSLDSTKPDTDSPFKFSAKTTRHSTINIEGAAKPFAKLISFNANGKLKGFDLRAASPATKQAIGHIIKSGQMDADLTLVANKGELDSNISLSLYQFNIKPMSKKDAEALDKKFGLPLNQTLVLLRDKDDSIHLDIPITGNVNNPSFDPMDAIIKATSKAATVTLITFYTPYGLIYAGGNVLFDLATAMNFDPLEFKPGSSTLEDQHKEKLDKLAKLMKEKPQIHLTLCGMTNRADYLALYPETIKDKNKKQTDDSPITAVALITKEQNNGLTKLALNRQLNIKNYLIEKVDIAHDRLILCAPEHKTTSDSISGVEINI